MSHRFFVYEAVNPMRRELVIGISDAASLDAVKKGHHARPPRRIARWDPAQDGVQYRVVERSLPISAALEFAAYYSVSESLDAFRVYLVSDSLVA